MPTSAQSSCFMATYRALGASSPTRIVPSPTATPEAASRATRSVISARILAASRSPSSRVAVIVPTAGRFLATAVRVVAILSSLGEAAILSSLGDSVAEVPFAAGHHHGDTGGVGGGHDLAVAHRPTGLDHGGHPSIGQGDQTVGEREEGVA